MNKADFNSIRNMIRAIWKGAIGSETAQDVWYNNLKKYDYELIKAAVNRYIEIGKFEPTPAEIIGQIRQPVKKDGFDPTPKFEMINGRKVRTYVCLRCQDSGMINTEDEERRVYGVPCDCPAGHYYFRWGWLTEEEQREYINKNGHHGEIIGENWYKMQPC